MQFCRHSRGSICELIDDFNECFDNKYISKEEYNDYKRDAYELIKILNAYIAKTKRMKNEYENSK